MVKELAIHNFRGIADGSLRDLTPLVVLVGPNGCGKSTLLDAIILAAHADVNQGVQAACKRRPLDGQQPRWLVRNATGTANVKLEVDDTRRDVVLTVAGPGVSATLKVEATGSQGNLPKSPRGLFVAGPPDISARLIEPVQSGDTSLAELYTRVAEQGRRREAKSLVADLIPGLDDIEILTQNGQATVYLVFPDGAHPAALSGDGVHLLLKLGFELAARAGGLALLEEPETHMHPAAISMVARAIWAAVRRQVQVIITTHSIDLIDAVVASATVDELEKLSLCRLRLTDGQLATSYLTGPDVAFSRSEIQDDLR